MQERIKAILKYLEEAGETQASLAKSAGISSTVVNQIIKGCYIGDSEKNLVKLENVIRERQEKRRACFQEPEYIDTSISRKVHNALSEAQTVTMPRILVLHGASGIGKTKSIEKYMEDHTTVNMVSIRPDFTIKAVLQTIANEINVDSTGSNFEVTNRILLKLKDSNRMLIFDEAEYLSDKSLDIIRRIYDMAKIPIVLVGMPKLFHNIKSLRKGFEQIANRMVSYNLGTPSKDDQENIILACIPKCETSVIKALIGCSRGTIRTLILLMQDMVNWSDNTGEHITATQVHKFVNSMH